VLEDEKGVGPASGRARDLDRHRLRGCSYILFELNGSIYTETTSEVRAGATLISPSYFAGRKQMKNSGTDVAAKYRHRVGTNERAAASGTTVPNCKKSTHFIQRQCFRGGPSSDRLLLAAPDVCSTVTRERSTHPKSPPYAVTPRFRSIPCNNSANSTDLLRSFPNGSATVFAERNAKMLFGSYKARAWRGLSSI
jgi:hypothetical protein